MKFNSYRDMLTDSVKIDYIFARSENFFAEAICDQVVRKISDQIVDSKLIQDWFFSEPILKMILDRVVERLSQDLEVRKK